MRHDVLHARARNPAAWCNSNNAIFAHRISKPWITHGCHIHVGTWEPVTSLPHICMCELVALLRGCYSHARACSPASWLLCACASLEPCFMLALHICELVALLHVVAMCMRELEALRCAGRFICSSDYKYRYIDRHIYIYVYTCTCIFIVLWVGSCHQRLKGHIQ